MTANSHIVNQGGDPSNPDDQYTYDPELPTPQHSVKKDLSGHRPTEMILWDLFTFSFGNLRDAANDPTSTIFENIFAFYKYYGVKDSDGNNTDLLALTKRYFAETKFEVRKNFPRNEYPLPVVAIHNAEENEAADAQQVMHHEAVHTNPQAMTSEELVGHNLTARVEIIIITDDPLTTLCVYRVVWFILFANKFHLADYADMQDIKLSGGAISFDVNAFPNWQYARQLNVNFQTLFDFYMPKTGVPAGVNFKMMLQQRVDEVDQ